MAKVEITTWNGDRLVVNTKDQAEIRHLEESPFDPKSNVSSVRVTEDRKG